MNEAALDRIYMGFGWFMAVVSTLLFVGYSVWMLVRWI